MVAGVNCVINSTKTVQRMRKIRNTQQQKKTIINYLTSDNYTNVLEEDEPKRYLADCINLTLNTPSIQLGDAEKTYWVFTPINNQINAIYLKTDVNFEDLVAETNVDIVLLATPQAKIDRKPVLSRYPEWNLHSTWTGTLRNKRHLNRCPA